MWYNIGMELRGVHARPVRNGNIFKLKRLYPSMSYSKLGRVFKISKQRVHAILKTYEARADGRGSEK